MDDVRVRDMHECYDVAGWNKTWQELQLKYKLNYLY